MKVDIIDEFQGNQLIQEIERDLQKEKEINIKEEESDANDEFGEDLDQYGEAMKFEERAKNQLQIKRAKPPKDFQDTDLPEKGVKITKDDRSTETIEVRGQDKEMVEMGFLPIVHLPFEVHPAFLDEKMSGSVEFKVKIKYKNGVKVGHMIECI